MSSGSDRRDAGTQQEYPETCQRCGEEFDLAYGGFFVGKDDVGKGAMGGTAEVFRQDVEEQLDREWLGFREEDIGPWCHDCSWKIQRKRSRKKPRNTKRNRRALDLFEPESTPDWVNRRMLLRDWIECDHLSRTSSQPIHIRPEDVGL